MSRAQELRDNLARVLQRIDEARSAAERADPVSLIVVTKRFPVSDITILRELGVTDIGENKEQELRAKAAEWDGEAHPRVHFIGQLQSNKAAAVARAADVVHSLDRSKLVRAFARVDRVDPLEVLVQVCLDAEPGRGGVAPAGLDDLVDEVAAEPALRLRGLMAVAPLGGDPEVAFARLADLHAGVLERHTEATWLSAGMSGDLKAAVRHGATHLRVGTAILGSRPSLG